MTEQLVYVGTYTDPSPLRRTPATPASPVMGMAGPTGSQGIYVYRQDPATGELSLRHTVSGVLNPSFLAWGPRRRLLFAVNEAIGDAVDDPTGAASGGLVAGQVSAFAVDSAGGALRFISRHPTGGGNPCHLSAGPSGRFLLVANHEHGRISVIRIAGDGSLGPIVYAALEQYKRDPRVVFIPGSPIGNEMMPVIMHRLGLALPGQSMEKMMRAWDALRSRWLYR